MNDVATPESQSAGGRVFAKRDLALAYLKGRGFQIGRTKFHEDCKKGLIPTSQSGQFEEAVLLAYAANLPTVAKDQDVEASAAAREKVVIETEIKKVELLRKQRRLDLDQGLLMPRADHQRDLAVRAQLFRNEIEGRDRRVAPALAEFVVSRLAGLDGVPPDVASLLRDAAANLAPEVAEFLRRDSEDLMDAWSADREFVVELDEPPGGDAA